MIAIDMHFRYQHPLGARAPYFDGLSQGRAMASRCGGCGRVSFAPARCCTPDFQWQELPGTGRVVAATDGFALIAMDGADNLTLGVLQAQAAAGQRVHLALAPGPVEHPSQAVFFQVDTGNCMASE